MLQQLLDQRIKAALTRNTTKTKIITNAPQTYKYGQNRIRGRIHLPKTANKHTGYNA